MNDGSESPSPRHGRGRALAHGALAVIVLGGGLAAGGWFLGSTENVGRRDAEETPARLVETTRVEVERHEVPVTAWGEVRPARELELRPQVGGRVEWVSDALSPGAVVGAGEEVLRLDRAPFETALRRARTALTRARADLALERGQQAVARREYELLDAPADDAERALMLRQPQLSSAEAAVSAAEADVADARRALDETALKAPFPALVRSESVATGAEVGTGTTVARLVGIDTWWVELALPSSALRWLEFAGDGGEGSPVRLRNERVWPHDVSREGRVIRQVGELEERGRLARVLVAVDDPLARGEEVRGPRLLLRSFLRAEIRGRTLERAVALEPEWLREGTTAWVMNEAGELEKRALTVAYRDAEQVLVTDGLDAGDRVIVSPLSLPVEGMPLRTADSAGTGGGGHGA